MTTTEIATKINPRFPWVYGPTTAPTKLLLKDGSTKVGYFQFIEQSNELQKDNKYSFVEQNNSHYYHASGDNKYVTIIDGNELMEVVYPAADDKDLPLEYVIRKLNSLAKDFERRSPKTEALISSVIKYRLDWGEQTPLPDSIGMTIGSTKQLLLGQLDFSLDSSIRLEYTSHSLYHIVKDFLTSSRISPELIFDIHSLVTGKESFYRTTGATPFHRRDRQFKYLPPELIASEIDKLLDWYIDHCRQPDFHPLLLAAYFHYKLVLIHPFADGNGRLARILTSLILLKKKMPPPIVEIEDRVFYIDALQRADAGDMEVWVKYLGKKVIASLEDFLNTTQQPNV
jgi:hypothetical protein